MSNLQSTVVMKTDIRGFTTKVGMLTELDLTNLLTQHKQFISWIATKHNGSIVKGEGDSFWIIFLSVTAASLAASEIQKELRAAQVGKGEDARLSVRVAITLGDVLHQEKDIFGEAVNLAARIESITPPDEIYLSHAAWLALNKAEVRTLYVDKFSLKGIKETTKIYKINQQQRTRIIKNQVVVISDLHGFDSFADSHSIEEVESLLMRLELLHIQICEAYGGTVRLMMGDAHFITFSESELALAAIQKICGEWEIFVQENQMQCPIRFGVTKGDLYQYRSFLFGKYINEAARLEMSTGLISTGNESFALVSNRVKNEISESIWKNRLRQVEITDKSGKEVHAYLLTN